MTILVINSGSSSIKFSIFALQQCRLQGELSGIGGDVRLSVKTDTSKETTENTVDAPTVQSAIHIVFDTVCAPGVPLIHAIGYRVVHAGPKLDRHQRITPDVLNDVQEACSFAPLHEPEAVQVIHEGMRRFADRPHYACFDTVFHQTMPQEAMSYPLPAAVRNGGVHRYGFHGLSCESIVRTLEVEGKPLPRRVIIAHLGSGCSVTALLDGSSIDTSMGLTPTGGIVMGTRPGDLDPAVVLYLLRHHVGAKDEAVSAVERMLNQGSGLAGLSGLPNDFKKIRAASASGNPDASLALQVFTRSVTKAIGSYAWLMGGVDAIVFSGGIGEHDHLTRSEILAPMQDAGIRLDAALNQRVGTDARTISVPQSTSAVLVVPAQEDRMIAAHVERLHRLEYPT